MIRKLMSLVIFFLSADLVHAEAISCPLAIKTNQEIIQPIDGWIAYSGGGKIVLAEAKIFNGHPDKYESLDPTKEEDLSEIEVYAKWILSPNIEHWIQCSYKRTNQIIIRKLPQEIKICEQHYSLSQRLVISMACH